MNSPTISEGYAPPLAPLKDRDLIALTALFDRDDSEEIDAEVSSKLRLMVPEPVWEEDPYEFLREYL